MLLAYASNQPSNIPQIVLLMVVWWALQLLVKLNNAAAGVVPGTTAGKICAKPVVSMLQEQASVSPKSPETPCNMLLTGVCCAL